GSAIDSFTYFGGSSTDRAAGLRLDTSGNNYIVGNADSADLPISTTPAASDCASASPYDATANGGKDVFVAKLNATGTACTWGTYLGGDGLDLANGMDIDASGDVFVAGQSDSTNFPNLDPGGWGSAPKGSTEGFVTKVASGGGSLVYSNYLTDSASDQAE